jgi:SAM-dependent methyltransferase
MQTSASDLAAESLRQPLYRSAAYQIVHIRPPGYVHAGALTEFAESTYHGLRRLGLDVRCTDSCAGSARSIVIGGHLLGAAAAQALPRDAIIYNSEQIAPDSPWVGAPYMQILRSREVWDYSAENVRRLVDLGVESARHVPMGYVPELSRIGPAREDIDVLFYGSINPRRQAILDELRRRGLSVAAVFGTYGEERDRAIARAKLVLSVHFYEAKVFEIVRASYLFTNFKALVAECGADTSVESDIRGAFQGVSYGELVDACVELVRDDSARRALAARGHAAFAARPAEAFLAAALGLERPERGTERGEAEGAGDGRRALPLPRTLHLGSGKDFKPEHFNVDINGAWGPDAVLDIAASDTVGARVETERFGAATIEEGYFDGVIANDVLEHIPDLTAAMTNCLRLLRPGGCFYISVPYDLSLGAWQDPTHVRAFNENSWLYYTDWHWYLGWVDMRFDTVSIEFQPSPFGAELLKAGTPNDAVIRTPRAIENMRVVMRKRYLQESERREAKARQPGCRSRRPVSAQ